MFFDFRNISCLKDDSISLEILDNIILELNNDNNVILDFENVSFGDVDFIVKLIKRIEHTDGWSVSDILKKVELRNTGMLLRCFVQFFYLKEYMDIPFDDYDDYVKSVIQIYRDNYRFPDGSILSNIDTQYITCEDNSLTYKEAINMVQSSSQKRKESREKLNYDDCIREGLCPECGSNLIFQERCKKCSNNSCGFSVCG